jgi:hypothetical protein
VRLRCDDVEVLKKSSEEDEDLSLGQVLAQTLPFADAECNDVAIRNEGASFANKST